MNNLEDLYYGRISIWENPCPATPEYKELRSTLIEWEQKVISFLKSEEERELFSKLLDKEGEMSALQTKEVFLEGFRLGAQLTLDTFLME